MAAADIPAIVRRASKQFVRYQIRWIVDKCKLKQMVKARRIGGSEAAAFSGAAKAIGFDPCTGTLNLQLGDNVNIVSAGRAQARKMLERCVNYILEMEKIPEDIDQAISLATKHGLPLTPEVITAICSELRGKRPNAGHIISKVKRRGGILRTDGLILGDPSADLVRLNAGVTGIVEIRAFAANHRTTRGFEGHVILDEFGVMPYQKEMWAAVASIADANLGNPEGYSLEIIGTPCGDDNMHYELAMTDAGKTFSRHRIDIYDAMRDGFPEVNIEKKKAECGLPEIFDQEYCCAFISAAARYIDPKMLDEATYFNEADIVKALKFGKHTATSGLDVANADRGPKSDKSALVRDYLVNEKTYWMHPDIKSGIGVSFPMQESWVGDELEDDDVWCVGVDATGMGRDMAQRLVDKFGDSVMAINFTAQIKEIMATRCKRLFQIGRQKIPDNADLRRGLLNLHRVIGKKSGKVLFDMKRGREGGHGDEAWALMCAQHVAEIAGGPWKPQKGWRSRAA